MSWITLQQPDGDWCIYSTVVDEFLLEDGTVEHVYQMHLEREMDKVSRKIDEIREQGESYYASPVSYEELKERSER